MMLTRMKRASRRSIALIWAMVGLFALAPALSMAFAAPVGAFSRSLVHTHADDEPGHGHHHHTLTTTTTVITITVMRVTITTTTDTAVT